MLLEDAGLITLVEDYNGLDSIENAIVDNPNDYQFEEVAPAQIPRALGDVDLGVINNGIAKDSNLHPINDSIYREDDTATDYVNIIAANSEDAENETYNRIAELYQEEDTAEFIEKEYDGALIPTVLELNDIGW
jgi:ABC-type metal ion transport system, periplasmic component/surface antigen